MRNQNLLYILSNGKVAAINKKDGSIVWEIKLRQYIGAGIGYNVGHIMAEDDKLYVAISGRMICLSARDGSLIWKNELKGWGYQFVAMANVQNSSEAGAIEEQNTASTAIIVS